MIVFTTFDREKHWKSHARRMVQTFEKHWPVKLVVVEKQNLLHVPPGPPPPSDTWRHDLKRFLWKASCIVENAIPGSIWLDADVVTLKRVPSDFLERMTAAPVTYLNRHPVPETGFMGFGEGCQPFLRAYREIYESGAVYELDGWADTHVARAAAELSGTEVANLCPGAKGWGHPWCRSPLAEYMDHRKGQRKKLSMSPEHPGAKP